LGHRSLAVDLPLDGPRAGPDHYATIVHDAMSALDEHPRSTVLVAHSLAGLTAPLVAARGSVHHVVYVAGVLPTPGRSLGEPVDDDRDRDAAELDASIVAFDDGSTIVPADAAVRFLFHDCEPALARWAAGQLRPQASLRHHVCPLDTWPRVIETYIVCTADRVVRPEWQRRVARTRLGIEPCEIDSGHSPFLSKPRELARLLAQEKTHALQAVR